jgi:hypothetical protein
MAIAQLQKISGLLKKYKRRIRLNDGWLLAQKTLWIAFAILLLLQLIGRLWPVSQIGLLSIIVLSGWFVGILGISLFKPLSTLRTAWRVDQSMAFKERVSSAIIFQDIEETATNQSKETKELILLQRSDALETLRNSTPKQAFKLIWLKRPLALAGILLIASLASIFLPNPMDAVLAERAAVEEAAQAEAEKIEELRQEIAESDQLSEEEREELLRALEELAEQLRENPGDRAEALASLSEAEQDLKDRLNPRTDLKQAALDALETKLSSLAQEIANPEDNNIADLEDALEALLSEMENMDPSELGDMSETLQQLAAQAAQAGATSLAEALSDMSQAAQSGDTSEAQAASEEVVEAAEQINSELTDQEAIEQALSQLQQSRQSLSQSGQTASSQSGQTADGQSSQGQQSGQGQGQGQQPGQGQSSGGGGGTNADSLPPNTGSGQAGDPQGQAQGGQTGNLDEQIYVPWERMQGENDPLVISGQDTGQGNDQIREQDTPLPGSINPVSVPYQDVYSSYLDTAYETIDQSYIPTGLKDYILEYFSQLEPDN